MSDSTLMTAWDEVADWVARALLKTGMETVVLLPLSEHSAAATTIVRETLAAPDYRRRKVAAILLGYTQAADTNLLEQFYEAEAARDAALAVDAPDKLLAQSVMEELVFAATRWCRVDDLQAAGLALLHKIVEATIEGDYWNSASYAMTTLLRYDAPGAGELLQRFAEFANTANIEHPSKPTLKQERAFAERLLENNAGTLNAIESVLDGRDRVLQELRPSEEQTQIVERLVAAARQYTDG